VQTSYLCTHPLHHHQSLTLHDNMFTLFQLCFYYKQLQCPVTFTNFSLKDNRDLKICRSYPSMTCAKNVVITILQPWCLFSWNNTLKSAVITVYIIIFHRYPISYDKVCRISFQIWQPSREHNAWMHRSPHPT
jgi:hypothetical protein